ncbi:MAG: DeoR/GlpR transcriptional regulator [Oscillospiraceae bacterium]|nr:DeoR/GlpR transcriptional regulator [Oscillospiraceae bacterium]
MSIYNREQKYLNLLSERDYTVKELSEKLFVSEPTVRRDIVTLKEKELIVCKRGNVKLKTTSADKRIPLFIRDMEHNEEKKEIALKAVSHIKDGDVIMLDASTTAYYLLPHLTMFKNILVITNGAKTALEAASMGIRTLCTGGEMTLDSFSYVGTDTESFLRRYNADVAFFSCRGLTDDKIATDNSILENSVRKIMIQNSKKSFLLCDKSKFSKKYLNTLCSEKEIDGIITN